VATSKVDFSHPLKSHRGFLLDGLASGIDRHPVVDKLGDIGGY
jgi:hypothetical protein